MLEMEWPAEHSSAYGNAGGGEVAAPDPLAQERQLPDRRRHVSAARLTMPPKL